MKQRIFVLMLFIAASLSVWAQDQITLRDGTAIEAKVMQITPAEISYRRFNNPDGPLIVIPRESVLSIRYENGDFEIINAQPPAAEKRVREKRPVFAAVDPDKLTYGVNANPGGALSSLGPSTCFEFNKGSYNTEISLIFPSFSPYSDADGGFGALAAFNYIWHHRIGSLYAGGGLGYIFTNGSYNVTVQYTDYTHTGTHTRTEPEDRLFAQHYFTFGLNLGYKLLTRSGVYFRMGIYLGGAVYGEGLIPLWGGFKPVKIW